MPAIHLGVVVNASNDARTYLIDTDIQRLKRAMLDEMLSDLEISVVVGETDLSNGRLSDDDNTYDSFLEADRECDDIFGESEIVEGFELSDLMLRDIATQIDHHRADLRAPASSMFP